MKKRAIRRFGLTLPGWLQRPRVWLAHRVHNLTRTQRIICASVAGILFLSVAIPTTLVIMKNQSYTLSAEVQSLVGTPNKNLSAKITYNREKDSWQFNQSNIPIGSSGQVASMPTVEDLKAQIGGTGKKDESLYAVDMPTSGTKGVTYYDTNTNLSFSLVPQFSLGEGRKSDEGHIVYPSQNGTKLIYTAKNNGMKEDIVLTKPIGDEASFSYTLNLPDTLTAKIQDDGSLGVFSPDPVLFGNISTGGDQDKEKLLSAQKTAAKDHLLFVLPAPVIVEAGGKKAATPASFRLSGSTLTVSASHLSNLQYPLSIDPSVVVTSSSDFASGNGDNISYDTDQISRAKLTGGTVNSWATTNGYSNSGTSGIGSVVYNGYLYAVGGNGGSTMFETVDYAPINSNGTVGTWASTTGMSTARTYHGFTIYNGYAYAIGGSTTGWSVQSSTEYAPVNSNGTLGAWTSTTALPTERTSGNTVAYNGYMYVIGGLTNSGVVNSVLYAPIKADGSLGSWSTTSSFTTARANSVSFAYNGKMYIIGGYDNASTYYSDAQYATINADGTLGSWTATTSYTTARAGAFGGVYGGYAYLAGGTSNANSGGDAYGDTQYAQINADGTLGPWRTMSATLASDRFAGSMSFYKGYLYTVGGIENGSGARTVQYATINPAGVTSNFATVANNFTTARALACSVAYNGYLYVLGGSTSDSGANNIAAVHYTALNSSTGNVGTWNTTTALPEARGSAGCTAYNGYVYIIGGYTGTNTGLASVRYAPINSDGTVGTWVTTASSLPTAKIKPGVFTYTTSSGTYLYSIAGNAPADGSKTTKSYYSLIGSSGSLGSWTMASGDIASGDTRIHQAFAQVGKYIYAMGGHTDSPSTAWSTVEYTSIQSSGDLSAWSTTTSMNTAIGFTNGTTVNGCIYSVGGEDAAATSLANVQYACPSSDGTISAWYNAPNLSVATTDLGVTSYNGYIYGTGGYTTSVQATTQFAAVNNGGGGGLNTWQQKTSGIGSALYGYGFAYKDGYVYTIGGDTSGGGSAGTTSTYYAPLNSDGSIGTWTATSSLNAARHSHGTYIVGNYMYVVGGSNTSGSTLSSIEYAPVNSNGTLGSWTTATATLSMKQFAAATANGYVYALGGTNGTLSSTVSYANVTSGNFSSWSTTTSLPYAVRNGSAVVYNNYLYVVGGIDGSGPTGKVIYAPINSNGTLGSWNYASTLPSSGATAAIGANGQLYTVGIDGASCNGKSYSATIYSDGSLSTFRQQPAAATCTQGNTAATYALGALYLPFGNGAVSAASVNSMARIGRYSKQINLGGGYAIASIAYGGTLPNGGLANVSYRAANSGASYGSSQAASSLPGIITGCVGAVDTMYVQLRATLDDTYTAVYPDTNSTAANITDATVNYQSPRAPTNQRLMHGKFFTGEAQQSLDTCGS